MPPGPSAPSWSMPAHISHENTCRLCGKREGEAWWAKPWRQTTSTCNAFIFLCSRLSRAAIKASKVTALLWKIPTTFTSQKLQENKHIYLLRISILSYFIPSFLLPQLHIYTFSHKLCLRGYLGITALTNAIVVLQLNWLAQHVWLSRRLKTPRLAELCLWSYCWIKTGLRKKGMDILGAIMWADWLQILRKSQCIEVRAFTIF